MRWVWTWGGSSFGYIDGDDLWTHDGKHVGWISDGEIFGCDGRYLGEVKHENRLITGRSKQHRRGPTFSPYARGRFALPPIVAPTRRTWTG